MIYLRLILTNLGRHRIRSVISVAGIAFSVAAMLTVVTVLQGAIGMFSGILSSGSELIVFERNVSDLFFSDVPASAVSQIAAWPIVAHADPVLFGVVSSADHPIITCFGITADDARLRNASWIAGDRSQFGQAKDGVVLGERAADFLSASPGGTVPIGHGVFRVVGILRTSNGFEDGGVFMPLDAARNFFHKDGSSVVTIKLRNKDDIAAFKREVKSTFPSLIALEDAEFSRSYSQFKILKATAWAVGGCGLALGGLGVANTMIMSVFTRIREIAILRVNGFSHAQIAAIIFGESAIVAIAGALTGLVVGTASLYGLKLVPVLHGYIDVTMHPALMFVVILLALLTGIAGALYPSAYAMRVRAVEALRFESTPATSSDSSTESAVSTHAVIQVEAVWKSYDEGAIAVLQGVSLQVSPRPDRRTVWSFRVRESTLLHLVGGLDQPDQGRISVNGIDLKARRNLTNFLRHEVGFVFQLHNLIPDLTLEENCLLPAIAAGIDRRTARTRLQQLADRTGLAHRLGQRIQKLSGGERQRTALCRALMNRASILLADEPTGSLDERTSAVVFELLLDLARTEGVTLLMATHDRALAGACDRMVEMRNGRIHER